MNRCKRCSKVYWKLTKKLVLGFSNQLSVSCLHKENLSANTGFEKATFAKVFTKVTNP